MTIFVAICAFFILPNFPRTTTWLTPEERELAVWRLEEDAGEADEDQRSVFWGFKLAVKDIRVYILMLMITCIVSSGGVTNFFPTVSHLPLSLLISFIGRSNSQKVQCHNTLLDSTSICSGSHYYILKFTACRPHRRTIFPHRNTTLFRTRSIYHRRCNNFVRPKVLRHDVDACRMLYRIRCLSRLDQQHFTSPSGQKGCGTGADQRSE